MNTLALIAAAATATTAAQGSTDPEAPTLRYALVIGVNAPAQAGQSPLRFADDDAIHYAQLFRRFPGHVEVLSLLDADTQALHPNFARESEVPSKERALQAIARLYRHIAAARREGAHTEFYFVYSGHGFVDERGEGHIGLNTDTLSRTEFFDHILRPSPANVNHVIVDACDAFFFVRGRGAPASLDARLDEQARAFLGQHSLEGSPRTGAILSTASAAQVHEWSEIRAGVFSHIVRSALLGGADANGDRRVSYSELHAFVLAANRGVRHAMTNQRVFIQPPAKDHLHPVVDLRDLQGVRRLRVEREHAGRITIIDELGRRYLDVNKADDFELSLALLEAGPYTVRAADGSAAGALDRVIDGRQPQMWLGSARSATVTIANRGAIAAAYERGLFAQAFGPRLVDGFTMRGELPELGSRSRWPAPHTPTLAWITSGATVLSAGAATALWGFAENERGRYERSSDATARAEIDTRYVTLNQAKNIAIGAAIASAITAAVLWYQHLSEEKSYD